MTDPAAVLADCAGTFQSVLGDRLLAAYALGSVAHGGYAPAVSDLDLALVLADTVDDDVVQSTWNTLRESHRKLSVFWSSLAGLRAGTADGRFPALDRLDLAEHGSLLLGTDVRTEVARPGADELLVDSARFAVGLLGTDTILAEFRQPATLLTDTVIFSKAILFPVRFQYSAALTSAAVGSNNAAIDWYLARPDPVGASLVRLAVAVRNGAPLDPAQAEPALLAELTPLYLAYLDDQIPRLRAVAAPAELVAAFSSWREKLTNAHAPE